MLRCQLFYSTFKSNFTSIFLEDFFYRLLHLPPRRILHLLRCVFYQFGFGSVHFMQCHCLFCTKLCKRSCSMFHWNGDEIRAEDRKNAAKQYKVKLLKFRFLKHFTDWSSPNWQKALLLQPVWIWVCVYVFCCFYGFFSACFKLELQRWSVLHVLQLLSSPSTNAYASIDHVSISGPKVIELI